MKKTISARIGGALRDIEAEEGTALAKALRDSGIEGLESPCGGMGLCGKCRVKLIEGELSPLDDLERRALSAAELRSGFRLACRASLVGDVRIELALRGEAAIVADGPEASFALDPPLRLARVELPEAQLGGADDESRLLAALAASLPELGAPRRVSMAALKSLAALRGSGGIEASILSGEVLSVASDRKVAVAEGGDVRRRRLGVGVDVGTTTVVCSLLDLDSGQRLGVASELNAQRPFGADVLSRIAASEAQGALDDIHDRITSQIGRMASGLAAREGLQSGDLSLYSIAGNTTMLHFVAGVAAGGIARAPFSPVFIGTRIEAAAELGLPGGPGCAALLLPGISAYVGADIVAGMAALRLHESPGRSLYLDLGTNGEIAFGGKEGILCCATAAGPAFEGAGIEMGMPGTEGAIDSVWLEGGEIRCSTIGGKPPVGICGSGLIDAVAALLDASLADFTGRLADEEEAASLAPRLASLLDGEGKDRRAYLDPDRRVYLSQADIRAAQLAKAAIAAGIDTLLAVAACEPEEVERLYLAGGFGSLLDVRGAARIGLLPESLADRVIVVGNASAAGAAATCLSASALEACERARDLSEYIELSGRPDFNEAYIERMAFPEGE